MSFFELLRLLIWIPFPLIVTNALLCNSRVSELHDVTLTKEKENFEKQRSSFDKRIRELMATIEAKESDHIKVRSHAFCHAFLFC